MSSKTLAVGGLLICLCVACPVGAASKPEHAVTASGDAPIFSPLKPLTDGGERVFGDPRIAGKAFVVRIKEMPGEIVPPHTHHFDENITVVQGTWYFGIGPKFNRGALHKLPVGSFVFVPKGTPMFGYSPDGTTVQIHGTGPWNQDFVSGLYTLTDQSHADGSLGVVPAKFRFPAGCHVRTVRGDGQILDGFATGEVVQYVVMGGNHQVFVAEERDVQKAQ
jgi:quercetin dioxygenase-like cupin family protein